VKPTAHAPSASAAAPGPSFEQAFAAAERGLRGALLELMAAVGADPSQAIDIAKQLGLDRHLARKLTHIALGERPAEVAEHLPGATGVRMVSAAFAKRNVPAALLDDWKAALACFDEVVATHAGDRHGLRRLLGSLSGGDHGHASRKAAFEANASVWGVHARVRLNLSVFLPSAETPGWVDALAVSGLLGLQRLRPRTSWPLVRQAVSREHETGDVDRLLERPLDPAAVNGSHLLRAFSTVPDDALLKTTTASGQIWELAEGPVGLTAAVDCVFGRFTTALGPALARAEGEYADAMVGLHTPQEVLLLDLLVHRDLPLHRAPAFHMFSRLETGVDMPPRSEERHRLPVDEPVLDLGQAPPAMATPHIPDYPELVQTALSYAGHELSEFRGWRVTVPHPPIPTAGTLRLPLPTREPTGS